MSENQKMYAKVMTKAWEHLREAIKTREQIYQGKREARDHFLEQEAQGKHLTAASEHDAMYKFMTSQTGSALIADQNWQMRQADMHSNMANALMLEKLLEAQLKTNQLLASINAKMPDQ